MSKDMPKFDPEKDPEWRTRLTKLQYHKLHESQGPRDLIQESTIWKKGKADHHCICCGHVIHLGNEIFVKMWLASISFRTQKGWYQAFPVDKSHGGWRVEVRCGSCDAHLATSLTTGQWSLEERDIA